MDLNWDHPSNQPATKLTIATMLCPSVPAPNRQTTIGNQKYGGIDYSPVAYIDSGLQASYLVNPWPSNTNGPMSRLVNSRRMADVRDGQSTTLLLTEVAGTPDLWRAGKKVPSPSTPSQPLTRSWSTYGQTIDFDGFSNNGRWRASGCEKRNRLRRASPFARLSRQPDNGKNLGQHERSLHKPELLHFNEGKIR